MTLAKGVIELFKEYRQREQGLLKLIQSKYSAQLEVLQSTEYEKIGQKDLRSLMELWEAIGYLRALNEINPAHVQLTNRLLDAVMEDALRRTGLPYEFLQPFKQKMQELEQFDKYTEDSLIYLDDDIRKDLQVLTDTTLEAIFEEPKE